MLTLVSASYRLGSLPVQASSSRRYVSPVGSVPRCPPAPDTQQAHSLLNECVIKLNLHKSPCKEQNELDCSLGSPGNLRWGSNTETQRQRLGGGARAQIGGPLSPATPPSGPSQKKTCYFAFGKIIIVSKHTPADFSCFRRKTP